MFGTTVGTSHSAFFHKNLEGLKVAELKKKKSFIELKVTAT